MHSIVRPGAMIVAAILMLSLANGPAMAGGAQEEANRKTVLDFYEKGLNQKDADAALAHVGNRYVQHNPNAADGPDGFRKFIGFLREKFPNSHSEIKRSFVDGDYVILHFTRFASPAARGARSWISSSWKAARSSSTGTSFRTFPRRPRTATRCSSS